MRGLKPPPPSGEKMLGQSGGVPWLTPTSQNRDVGEPQSQLNPGLPGLKPGVYFACFMRGIKPPPPSGEKMLGQSDGVPWLTPTSENRDMGEPQSQLNPGLPGLKPGVYFACFMRGIKPPPPSGEKMLGQSGGVPWLTPTSENRDMGEPQSQLNPGLPGLKPGVYFACFMRGLNPPPPSGEKMLGQSGGVPWLTPTSQNRDMGEPAIERGNHSQPLHPDAQTGFSSGSGLS